MSKIKKVEVRTDDGLKAAITKAAGLEGLSSSAWLRRLAIMELNRLGINTSPPAEPVKAQPVKTQPVKTQPVKAQPVNQSSSSQGLERMPVADAVAKFGSEISELKADGLTNQGIADWLNERCRPQKADSWTLGSVKNLREKISIKN